MKIPDIPYQVANGGGSTRARTYPTGRSSPSPGPAGPSSKRCDQMIYCQFRANRARRTLRGIDEQVAKDAKAVAVLATAKRNRFIALDSAVKTVNREPEAKARDLAGLKGDVTNLAACPTAHPSPRTSSSAATTSCGKSKWATADAGQALFFMIVLLVGCQAEVAGCPSVFGRSSRAGVLCSRVVPVSAGRRL
jgi:hypothetical protein